MSLAAAKTEPPSQGRIPVLEIAAYLAGEAGAAAPLPRGIARTCEDTAFLVVANHGVPQRLVDDTFAVAQQFFARPDGDKLALKVGTYSIVYLPFGGQVVRHSPVDKNTKPNFSESFYITRDRAPDHPDIVNEKLLVGLNRWPEDLPEFRAATTAFYRTPFFLGPDHAVVVEPVPSCVGPDNPRRSTTYGAFTRVCSPSTSPTARLAAAASTRDKLNDEIHHDD